MRSLVATRTAAAVAATLMLAACGGAPTSPSSSGDGGNAREDSEIAVAAAETYDKFNGMSGQERTDELVACAEEEGQLNVYTSNTDMEDLIDVFSDEYDVEVNNYRAGSESVLQRLLQEDEAGYYGADVFETNALELGVADEGGPALPLRGRAARLRPGAGPPVRGLDRDAVQRLRRRLEHRQGEGRARSPRPWRSWPSPSGRAGSRWRSATSTGSPRCTTSTSTSRA